MTTSTYTCSDYKQDYNFDPYEQTKFVIMCYARNKLRLGGPEHHWEAKGSGQWWPMGAKGGVSVVRLVIMTTKTYTIYALHAYPVDGGR